MSEAEVRFTQLVQDIQLAVQARNKQNVEPPANFRFISTLTREQLLDLFKSIGQLRNTLDKALGKVVLLNRDRAYNTARTALLRLLASYELLAMLNGELAATRIADPDHEC